MLKENREIGIYYDNNILIDWSMLHSDKLINKMIIKLYLKCFGGNECQYYGGGHQYLKHLLSRMLFYGTMSKYYSTSKIKIHKKLSVELEKKEKDLYEYICDNYKKKDIESILEDLFFIKLPHLYLKLLTN